MGSSNRSCDRAYVIWTSVLLVLLIAFVPYSSAFGDLVDIGIEGTLDGGSLVSIGEGDLKSRANLATFDGGSTDFTYAFHGDEVRKTHWITLENNSYVDKATMMVRGEVRTKNTTEYPVNPRIDIGDDGDIEWAFEHQGFGKFGYQDGLANESLANRMDISSGVEDTSTTIRLPLNATVNKATMNIEGIFRMEPGLLINGTDVQEELARSLSFVGDLNGDTWQDFALGIPLNDTTSYSDAGKVMIFFGGPTLNETPDLVMTGTNDSDEFGYNVKPAGDVNNDGYDDLLVGAPFNDTWAVNAGRVYIFYGGNPMDNVADVVMAGEDVGNWFGYSAIGAGDINNDGYDDIVSSAPTWSYSIGETNYLYGRMYFYLGGAPMDPVADLVVQGPTLQSSWAWAMAPVGDFNNDGYDDFVAGSYSNDEGCANCGKVELFLGGSLIDGTPDLTILGSGSEELGNSVAPLGDVNKDGYDDFIAGAYKNSDKGSSTGAAYVFFGGSTLNGNADLSIHGPAKGDWFGCTVGPGGDINKDGWLDIVVGAEMNDSPKVDTGAVFVYFGGSTLDNGTDMVLAGETKDDRFGHSVSGGVDMNKDGFYDLLVGGFLNDAKATNGGRGYLYTTVPKKAMDPVLDLTGSADPPGSIWSSSGMFVDNITVADFSKALNQYLVNATVSGTDGYLNQYVDISFGITTTYDAELVLSNISISYDYDALVDVNPSQPSKDMRSELDSKIPHQDTGTTDVALWARSQGKGRLYFHSLDIITDEGPTLDVLTGYTMDEDTLDGQLIDLYDHFDDDYDPDDFLTYEVVSFTNGSHVNVTLNGTHFVSVDALSGPLNDNWTGTTDIRIKATDTRGLSKESGGLIVSVIEVNDPPMIISMPKLTAISGSPYSYQMIAEDDTGALTFVLVNGPKGMAVDGASGLVSWTPTALGDIPVSLRVTDGELGASQDFMVNVQPPNDAPIITSDPGLVAVVGVNYVYQLEATDRDGDAMTAALTMGPSGLTMDQEWNVSFIPRPEQVGSHQVSIEVSDGKVVVNQTYTLTVTSEGLNNVPQIVSLPTTIAVVGYTYDYTLVAIDDDGDVLSFVLDEAPSGMTLERDLIEWVPNQDQVGGHDVTVRVSDGYAFSFQNFNIQVSATGANHAPVIVSSPPLEAMVGKTYEYQVVATDDDLDDLVYTMDTSFKRMSLDPGSGILVWHPTSDTVGNQTLRVRVSDSKGFDTQTFTVNVAAGNKNGIPIFLSHPATNGKVGENYTYQPQVEDPDQDPMTFILIEGPTGMTIEPTTGLISWIPAKGQSGNVSVVIKASDGLGYTTQDFVIAVEDADIVAELRVAITTPADGVRVSTNVTIMGTAGVTVGEIYEVQIKIDALDWVPAKGLENWEYKLDVTTLKNGRHTISARSWDGNQYSDVKSIEITVDKATVAPVEEPFKIMGMDGFLFLLMLIVILIIIVGIAMAMKGGHRTPPPMARRREGENGPRYRDRRRSRSVDRHRDGYDDDHEDHGYHNEGPDRDYSDGDYHDDHYDEELGDRYDKHPYNEDYHDDYY